MLLEDLNGIVKCSMQSKSTGWLGHEVVMKRHKFSQAPSRHARKKRAQPRESDELQDRRHLPCLGPQNHFFGLSLTPIRHRKM